MQGNFDRFLADDEQKPKLVSAYSPRGEQKGIVMDFNISVLNIYYYFKIIIAAPLKETRKHVYV